MNRQMKSGKSHARLDRKSRIPKAGKIISILEMYANLRECEVLDVGTGSGHIAQLIASKCKSLISVDLNDERVVKKGYVFRKINDERLPFENNKFDIVVSNHVLEHIPNQCQHINEIHRILKKNGLLYLATPNKYWIVDPHYKLPFVTLLPRKFSSFLTAKLRKKEWDIYSLSYKKICKLFVEKFEINNLTLEIIKNPGKYNVDEFKKFQLVIKSFPEKILKLFNAALPTYILVMRKK